MPLEFGHRRLDKKWSRCLGCWDRVTFPKNKAFASAPESHLPPTASSAADAEPANSRESTAAPEHRSKLQSSQARGLDRSRRLLPYRLFESPGAPQHQPEGPSQ